jgi:hypothetical protein
VKERDGYSENLKSDQYRTDVKNVGEVVKTGRKRWEIENEGFNTQKTL